MQIKPVLADMTQDLLKHQRWEMGFSPYVDPHLYAAQRKPLLRLAYASFQMLWQVSTVITITDIELGEYCLNV